MVRPEKQAAYFAKEFQDALFKTIFTKDKDDNPTTVPTNRTTVPPTTQPTVAMNRTNMNRTNCSSSQRVRCLYYATLRDKFTFNETFEEKLD